MPSDRPELSSMADDYARYALSQRASFEATHPSVLAAARLFADERVLRVADLGAANRVNSHGLIRELAAQRAGRPLVYALVDLPTNPWRVTGEHLRRAFGDAADGSGVVVIPAPGDTGPGVADAGTGAHFATPEAHGEACRRVVEREPGSRHGDQHGGHPAGAGALPAAGKRARRGQRDGDALGRRFRRLGVDGIGLPGLPGPP